MEKFISALQNVIAIDSSTKQGAVECLHYVLDMAEKMGFRTGNLDDMVGWAEYGEGEEMVAVLGHLDVVPVGDGWTKPPFGGVIEDGRLYGRGAIDDKGPILAALFALDALRREGFRPRRRVRVLFGTEEETGTADMTYYVNNGGELPVLGFTPDGSYPLIHGEKGLLVEEYACDCDPGPILRAWSGKGENAAGKLLAELAKLPLEGKLEKAVAFLHGRIGMETKGESLGVYLEDEISGPLSFNLGMLRLDASGLRVTVNYRYPVTCRYEDCVPQVRAAFAQAGFRLASASHSEKLYVPEDAPLVQKLIGVYNAYTGENARPICIGGGTYAKSMPNILAFGPAFPGEEATEHQPDEYIDLERLRQCYDMTKLAIVALSE